MPLTATEMSEILAVCEVYQQHHSGVAEATALRLRALVLLLRYSGLRIQDAATLERSRISSGKLFLYQAKTGTAVYCPLPPFLVALLDALPGERYFFWTGRSEPKTVAGYWQCCLLQLFKLTRIARGHAHRFRDTFAVELLLAGVPMERVSALLGHRSIRVTEKHYSPWVRARQEQLEADVRRTWATDDFGTRAAVGGTSDVHGKAGRPN